MLIINSLPPNTLTYDVNLISYTTKLDRLHYKTVIFDLRIDIMQIITRLSEFDLFPAT